MSKKYLDDTGLSTLVSEILEHFQKKLTAGTNITIDANNVISASGGGTDTGATSITTTGSGNAVTTASYDASTRKITLTKGSTFLTSAVTSLGGFSGSISPAELGSLILRSSTHGASSGVVTFRTGLSGDYANLQIVWGRVSAGTSNNTSITFTRAFTIVPVVSVTWQKMDNTTREWNLYKDVSTSGFTMRKNSGDSASSYYEYIAIGWASSASA